MTALPRDHKKQILVTGGGTGMGQSIAIAMAENGSRVAISGRRIDKLRETASKSKGSHEILCHEADVTDRKSLETLFEWLDNEIGKIDCLVHAAGINIALRSMQELEPANWDQLIGINLTGTYNVLRCALPRMRAHGKGLVILINSVAGKRSVPLGGIGYNASKFGMSGLGIGLAEEERENGIRITNLYPGEVNTPILEKRKNPPSEEHRSNILQSDDIASVVSHLISLPDRVHIPELVVKPANQSFV